MEYAWPVLLHKVVTSILGVYIVEQVLDEASQQLRLVIRRRSQLEAHVRCREVELILNLYVIRFREIVINPLVEIGGRRIGIYCLHRGVVDRLSEVVVAARGKAQDKG